MTLPPALPKGLHAVATLSKRIYRRLTPDSPPRIFGLIFALQIIILMTAATIAGIFYGASTAVDGGALAPRLADLWGQEQQVWIEMTANSPVARAIWGLFHWLLVLGIWLSVQGAKLGFAVPELGYAMEYVSIVLYALFGLAGLQVIRIVELIVRGGST